MSGKVKPLSPNDVDQSSRGDRRPLQKRASFTGPTASTKAFQGTVGQQRRKGQSETLRFTRGVHLISPAKSGSSDEGGEELSAVSESKEADPTSSSSAGDKIRSIRDKLELRWLKHQENLEAGQRGARKPSSHTRSNSQPVPSSTARRVKPSAKELARPPTAINSLVASPKVEVAPLREPTPELAQRREEPIEPPVADPKEETVPPKAPTPELAQREVEPPVVSPQEEIAPPKAPTPETAQREGAQIEPPVAVPKEGAALPEALTSEPARREEEPIKPPEIRRKTTDGSSPQKLPAENRKIVLSGTLFGTSLKILIDQFCDRTEEIEIDNCKEVRPNDVIRLRKCLETKKLSLEGLPNVKTKTIEQMFSSETAGEKVWSELREVRFSKIPVSDKTLRLISQLEKLEKITLLSGCDEFTVQGFYRLMKGCPSLTFLSVCPSSAIDPFAIEDFRKARPNVQLEIKPVIDATIFDLAIHEAKRRMQDPDLQRKFIFLQKLIGGEAPLPEGSKIEWDQAAVSQFYIDRVRALGAPEEFDFNGMVQGQGYPEQILQAYLNISRAAWVVREQLIRGGFPADIPREVGRIIDLLDSKETVMETVQVPDTTDLEIIYRSYLVAETVKVLDFTGLGLTYLPYFILDRTWSRLKEIILQGTWIEQLSDSFKEKLPDSATIQFPNWTEALLKTLASPRANNSKKMEEVESKDPNR